MKKLVFLILLISTLSLTAQTRYIDSSFSLKERITRTYATKDNEDLKLDIYQPAEDTLGKRPIIVFMHGGGFAGGDRRNEAEVKFAKMAAQKGYVAVLISYRLTRKGKSFGCDYKASGKIETFRKAAEDFLDAVNYMEDQKTEFKIDTSKIIIGGSSAGAEAILQAAYNRDLLFPEGKYPDMKFAGVFSLAGAILDARYITSKNDPPAVFFHGTADNLVPYASAAHHYCKIGDPGYIILDGARTISKKLKELKVSYMLYTFEDAKHEISGMPFDYLPQVFKFFNDVFLKGGKQQIEVFK